MFLIGFGAISVREGLYISVMLHDSALLVEVDCMWKVKSEG